MPATDIFRCIPLEVVEIDNGRAVTTPFDPARFPIYASVIVDGSTGIVRMSGLSRQTWRIASTKPDEDLVVVGPLPIDGIWIRHWRSPITFLAMFWMTTIITGTCEVVQAEGRDGGLA